MLKQTVLWLAVIGTTLVAPVASFQPLAVAQQMDMQADGQLAFNRAVMRAGAESGLSRRELFRLRMGLMFHGNEIRANVAGKLWSEGALPDAEISAIDWERLVEALKELLPLILEFIAGLQDLFGNFGQPAVIASGAQMQLGSTSPGIKLSGYGWSKEPQTPQPVSSPLGLVMHTIPGCAPCKAFVEQQAPRLADNIAFRVVDDQAAGIKPMADVYPYFEFVVGGETKHLHKGSRTADQIHSIFATL